jgi:hypothetical protein
MCALEEIEAGRLRTALNKMLFYLRMSKLDGKQSVLTDKEEFVNLNMKLKCAMAASLIFSILLFYSSLYNLLNIKVKISRDI